jgi:hypothetical protein
MIGRLRHWWRDARERVGPRRRLRLLGSDILPAKLPKRDLVLTEDDGELWSVGMQCPCRCGDIVELMLLTDATPRWTLMVDAKGRPSLSPSVWRKAGCRAHYWVVEGRVRWCK